MRMNPYLSFRGDCEEAFAYYREHLGAEVGRLFRYAGSPMADQVPADWGQKIMHGTVTIGGAPLMGGDVTPSDYQAPRGFSMSLALQDTGTADRMFRALAEGGTVLVPLAETFWAARFGMVTDRFGIPWMINCERPDAAL
jgi:PhnB protein